MRTQGEEGRIKPRRGGLGNNAFLLCEAIAWLCQGSLAGLKHALNVNELSCLISRAGLCMFVFKVIFI